MTYSNIVFSNNLNNFLKAAKKNNIDGFIIPDLNVEDSQDYINITKKLGLATVFLCAPNTSKKRLVEIASASYWICVHGFSFWHYRIKKQI